MPGAVTPLRFRHLHRSSAVSICGSVRSVVDNDLVLDHDHATAHVIVDVAPRRYVPLSCSLGARPTVIGEHEEHEDGAFDAFSIRRGHGQTSHV